MKTDSKKIRLRRLKAQWSLQIKMVGEEFLNDARTRTENKTDFIGYLVMTFRRENNSGVVSSTLFCSRYFVNLKKVSDTSIR